MLNKLAIKKVNMNEIVLKMSVELARKAGDHLIKKQKKISSLKVTHKLAQGVATSADTESEKIIITGIKKKFPGHEILAEESAYKKYNGEKSQYNFLKEKEWVWIIDPLDGTNNFLNGLDYFAVCISLVYKGEPIVGVVYRPINGDLFYALKGKGAFFKNLKSKGIVLKLSSKKNKKSLKDSLLVTGFTSEKGEVFDREFELFKQMMGKSRGIRRMGSAALDLCYVAHGIFDCFWERGLAPWDVAAAGLICHEANVSVSDYSGQSFHPFQETILAARSPLKEEVLNLFSKSL
jgi:myo-inositol-1(or 4)-monophosphatase